MVEGQGEGPFRNKNSPLGHGGGGKGELLFIDTELLVGMTKTFSV